MNDIQDYCQLRLHFIRRQDFICRGERETENGTCIQGWLQECWESSTGLPTFSSWVLMRKKHGFCVTLRKRWVRHHGIENHLLRLSNIGNLFMLLITLAMSLQFSEMRVFGIHLLYCPFTYCI